ncbi:hypothetical protein IB237_23305 [Agrobacterium sp. AGB01]|uniref:hypothetical protein n=1 Tax=Agrobacterium sp. AGB01 TaxID=2769302 RepID=UPI001785FE3B|nr:hypothetical protein [Agrobacterium sp. AGB01]MBD9390132.1 hypothetical protein [Agrobacterium sp. AGB01]
MLSAEALRLTLIEVLLPTGVATSGAAYPTLAAGRVYDSRPAPVEDLDRADDTALPCLSLFTTSSGVNLRGDASSNWDTIAYTEIEIVAELMVKVQDDDGGFADAAETDPEGRMILAALCSQVRRLIEVSPLVRKIVRKIEDLDEPTFAVPELGLRYHRIMMKYRFSIKDDVFSQAGGLPEPCASVLAALPEQSYAREKLEALALQFPAQTMTPLKGVDMRTGSTVPGATVNFPS